VKAAKAGDRTWMLVTDSGQCQPLPTMLARIRSIDQNGPPPNEELFRWLSLHNVRGHRACEYKVHHPRACRAFAFETSRGFVIVRIEDKTESGHKFTEGMRSVKAAFEQFLREGERYD